MKEKILKLREEGKTYNEIQAILGCSKGTICYHCGENQKTKTKERTKIFYDKKGGLYKKLKGYCLDYCSNARKNRKTSKMLNCESVQSLIGPNPVCYLTGDPIDLSQLASYSLDHKIPIPRGGDSSLENLGLTTKQANQCKSNLTPDELFDFCKKVLTYNGFSVSEKSDT